MTAAVIDGRRSGNRKANWTRDYLPKVTQLLDDVGLAHTRAVSDAVGMEITLTAAVLRALRIEGLADFDRLHGWSLTTTGKAFAAGDWTPPKRGRWGELGRACNLNIEPLLQVMTCRLDQRHDHNDPECSPT